MDEDHLPSAARYVSLNPVRAGLALRAQDWPWSSARAHVRGEDDGLTVVRPVLERVEDFAALIDTGADARHAHAIRVSRAEERTGRPLGNEEFVGIWRLGSSALWPNAAQVGKPRSRPILNRTLF
jgi:putative transposase